MATALQSARFSLRRCNCRHSSLQYITKSIGRREAFSSTSLRWQDQPNTDAHVQAALEKLRAAPGIQRNLDLEIERAKKLLGEDVKEEIGDAAFNVMSMYPSYQKPFRKRPKQTFMNIGESEPMEDLEDDIDTGGDITSLAHGELEQVREMRHYARLAAWDMPLLAKLAKPFEPPTADMPLRFRYTTYMGEQHPAEKKVVLEFCTEDMPDLTTIQREKLQKLIGVRYNPETDIVRMSCEMFETQAQNKRYLGDLVDTLLQEARDPADTFEDVPLDTRHHVFKTKPKFPPEWRLTEERRAELAEYRQGIESTDSQRMLTGKMVDGIRQIQDALVKAKKASADVPEMAVGAKGGKGKGKKVAVRR